MCPAPENGWILIMQKEATASQLSFQSIYIKRGRVAEAWLLWLLWLPWLPSSDAFLLPAAELFCACRTSIGTGRTWKLAAEAI